MFVNDYLEFKSKARKEIKDVVFDKLVIDEPNEEVLYDILNTKRIEYADKLIRLLI